MSIEANFYLGDIPLSRQVRAARYLAGLKQYELAVRATGLSQSVLGFPLRVTPADVSWVEQGRYLKPQRLNLILYVLGLQGIH